MFVRVFDKKNQRYYKSMVYCAVDSGWYRRYVVVDPHTGCFELVDYLDKTGEPTPLVEIIQADSAEWVRYENALLLKYKAWCRRHFKPMLLTFLWGYKDICENYGFLTALLEQGSVPLGQFDVQLRELPDQDEWTYIHTQEDADAFMEAFAAFHDSRLEKLVYEEGSGTPKVTAVFDNRCWFGIAELCFEGVLAVNIRPPRENFFPEIWEGTLRVDKETVFWADQPAGGENPFDGASFISALSLKWRKIG